MTTGKTIALTRWTFAGKVMSLLFNMLSTLVITFLPRSKRLLISWLQSPSAVILEPRKIKSLSETLDITNHFIFEILHFESYLWYHKCLVFLLSLSALFRSFFFPNQLSDLWTLACPGPCAWICVSHCFSFLFHPFLFPLLFFKFFVYPYTN